ncbi:MAG: chemotaxis protein CheA [Bdellovibrionia bacterium]
MAFEPDFMQELQMDFLREAQDLLGRVEELSLALEKRPGAKEVFDELARLAHNLKGSGKAVGFDEIARLGHALEDYILGIQSSRVPGTPENLDFLFHCLDQFQHFIEVLLENPQAKLEIEGLLKAIEARSQMSAAVVEPVRAPEPTQRVGAATDTPPPVAAPWFKLPKSKLDFLLEVVGEQVILQSALDQGKVDWMGNQEFLLKTISQITKLTSELQDHVLSLSMVSIQPTYTKLERAARDAARICQKEVDVIFSGESTEVDKTLMEELSDPLTHMVRNAVDHGLEEKSDRIKRGKPSLGKISVSAQRVGGQLWIEVGDDGRGLDPQILKAKAREKNLISAAEAQELSDAQALALIFKSGFSTKEQVSEVSGRGVGMNVVQEKIEKLRGQMEILSEVGKGTTFRMKLPLSLSIFNGAVVRVQKTRYVVPALDISEIIRVRSLAGPEYAQLGEGRSSLRIREELFEVVDLRGVLGGVQSSPGFFQEEVTALLVRKSRKVAFLVNEVLGVQKIVQKPLGLEMKGKPGYAAGTILGDGMPAVILSFEDLIEALFGLTQVKHHAA